MKVLLTGASGFLGNIIFSYLSSINLNVSRLGRRSCDDIIFDFSSENPSVISSSFELIIHSAGKAHFVPKSIEEESLFFNTNVRGTQNMLNELEKSSVLPKSFVFISSVAVYGASNGVLINEKAPLLATDPYGKSKIQAEKLISEWCKQNDVICTILRLPLLVGPNPPGNLGTMIKGIRKGYYFNIGGGTAKKSMVLAADVAKIILKVASIGGVYNLTDGYHPSFFELAQYISKQMKKKKPLNVPIWIAIIMAKIGDIIGSKFPINSDKLNKIISDLTFDDALARQSISWNSNPILAEFQITE